MSDGSHAAADNSAAAAVGPILDVDGVTLQYKTKEHLITATYRVGFKVYPADRFVLLGPSGCGKSTLLKGVAGYLKPVEGNMRLKGVDIKEPGPDRVMVFQEFDQLLPWKTVKQNITFALMNGGRCKTQSEADDIAMEYIKKVKLDRFENTFPHMLSGGMKQRVAIARGMAMEPDVLLMDEPFAALDALTRLQMQEELLQLWEDTHFTSPHPGQVKAELNAHHLNHANVGQPEFAALQQKIHNMLFADRILEDELVHEIVEAET
jgi:NitT/TauT family transport system ATP-binding protein